MLHLDPNSKAAKVILVFGIPIFAAFLLCQCVAFCRSARSYWWPIADGVVTKSTTHDVMTEHGKHEEADITYAYAVNGTRYQNDTIAFGVFRGMTTPGHAHNVLERFPQGAAVAVYYDSHRPNISCLQRGGIGWEDVLMFPVSASGIVLGLRTLTSWLRRRRGFVPVAS